jgi:toxin-antitoxin system PIN domain toxin
MMLPDTNVLIYAHRRDADRHEDYREWLESLIDGPEPYAVSDQALMGVIRVVTNPRIYQEPATIEEALAFADQFRNQPHAQVISPGPNFWDIFAGMCGQVSARGNLVPDVYLAALATEHGCEIVTADGDFKKFAGLRSRHPLA